MILNLVGMLVLAAVTGAAAGAVYLLWPRRVTAEEWVLHRRAVSPPIAPPAAASPPTRLPSIVVGGRLLRWLESMLRPEVELLQLVGEQTLDVQQTVGRMTVVAAVGGTGGVALVLMMVTITQGTPSPVALLLPFAGVLLLPLWSWVRIRRRASEVRERVERRLPQSLVAARVLLESGAATPEGALGHVVSVYRDPAADLVAEALRLRTVRHVAIEDAMVEVSRRYRVAVLARLADSLRVGVRQGTPMAELLARQSQQLRQRWFAAYRERVTRAPVMMTVPALVFFVSPLLVLIMFMVFAPLAGLLGSL